MKYFLFIFVVYPLVLAHGITVLMVLIPLFISIILFFFFFLPFGNIGDNDIFGESIQYHIGQRNLYLACLFVIAFYPLLLLQALIVYAIRLCVWAFKRLCRLPYSGGAAYELLDSFWIGIKTSIEYIVIALVLPCLIV